MDVDGRIERDQPEGRVRNARVGGPGQHSGGATVCDELDGFVRKFLAVWGHGLRLEWKKRLTQRSLGVRAEHGRVDMGERRECDRPVGGVWYGGDAGSRECSEFAIRWTDMGRCARKSLAVWRRSLLRAVRQWIEHLR